MGRLWGMCLGVPVCRAELLLGAGRDGRSGYRRLPGNRLMLLLPLRSFLGSSMNTTFEKSCSQLQVRRVSKVESHVAFLYLSHDLTDALTALWLILPFQYTSPIRRFFRCNGWSLAITLPAADEGSAERGTHCFQTSISTRTFCLLSNPLEV